VALETGVEDLLGTGLLVMKIMTRPDTGAALSAWSSVTRKCSLPGVWAKRLVVKSRQTTVAMRIRRRSMRQIVS
jgi:hypothetical protein